MILINQGKKNILPYFLQIFNAEFIFFIIHMSNIFLGAVTSHWYAALV